MGVEGAPWVCVGYRCPPGPAPLPAWTPITPALLLSLLVSAPAQAARKGACEPLKPEQRLSEEQQRAVDAAIQGGVVGMGRGQGSVSTSAESRVELRVLSEDDLARSWFLYQTCVMRDSGLINDSTAQELVRDLMGLKPLAHVDPGQGGQRTPAEQVGSAAIQVVGRPSTAHIYLDGAPRGQLGEGRVLPVEPGRHSVLIKLPGYRPVKASVDVQPGTKERVEVAGLSARRSPVLWVGLSILVAGFVGTGVMIGAIAAQTL